MKVLVTGAAGFIGYHTARALAERGDAVVGLDNLNGYYDPELKLARLAELAPFANFRFVKMDLADATSIGALFEREQFDRVVHLAAQAGVRYSIENPRAYADSNLSGFLNIIEGCRATAVAHCVFASSSSVYGANPKLPFSVDDNVDHPLSFYAATKKANELMAHTYASLYGCPMTGLRFFTVYGPWGRPDMALFIFTRNILAGLPIEVFNGGHHARDFTYIGDVADGVVRALDRVASADEGWAATPGPASSAAPYRIYNIGNGQPIGLGRFIEIIEQATGRAAVRIERPLQPGDVAATCADIRRFTTDTGFRPSTSIEDGVRRFVDWYRRYYAV